MVLQLIFTLLLFIIINCYFYICLDKNKKVLVYGVLFFMLMVMYLFSYTITDHFSYKRGQADYANGIIKVELQENEDQTREWVYKKVIEDE